MNTYLVIGISLTLLSTLITFVVANTHNKNLRSLLAVGVAVAGITPYIGLLLDQNELYTRKPD